MSSTFSHVLYRNRKDLLCQGLNCEKKSDRFFPRIGQAAGLCGAINLMSTKETLINGEDDKFVLNQQYLFQSEGLASNVRRSNTSENNTVSAGRNFLTSAYKTVVNGAKMGATGAVLLSLIKPGIGFPVSRIAPSAALDSPKTEITSGICTPIVERRDDNLWHVRARYTDPNGNTKEHLQRHMASFQKGYRHELRAVTQAVNKASRMCKLHYSNFVMGKTQLDDDFCRITLDRTRTKAIIIWKGENNIAHRAHIKLVPSVKGTYANYAEMCYQKNPNNNIRDTLPAPVLQLIKRLDAASRQKPQCRMELDLMGEKLHWKVTYGKRNEALTVIKDEPLNLSPHGKSYREFGSSIMSQFQKVCNRWARRNNTSGYETPAGHMPEKIRQTLDKFWEQQIPICLPTFRNNNTHLQVFLKNGKGKRIGSFRWNYNIEKDDTYNEQMLYMELFDKCQEAAKTHGMKDILVQMVWQGNIDEYWAHAAAAGGFKYNGAQNKNKTHRNWKQKKHLTRKQKRAIAGPSEDQVAIAELRNAGLITENSPVYGWVSKKTKTKQ